MATGNNLRLDVIKKYSVKMKNTCARFYRPGISAQDSLQYIIDWIGDKNNLMGAASISFLIAIFSFTLFSFSFACLFSIVTTILIFIGTKLIFYKPKEYSIELEGEDTILSFVKDVHVNGESEIVVHSQPGYGKNKNTFVLLQLSNSVSILDCRNITSVIEKSYRDIEINFFHPAENEYSISCTSKEGGVVFEVLQQTADQCRVKFSNPLRNTIRVDFNPS